MYERPDRATPTVTVHPPALAARRSLLRRAGLCAAVCCLGLMAVLIWSRLKLVAGVPRSVYADPAARAAAESLDPRRQLPQPVPSPTTVIGDRPGTIYEHPLLPAQPPRPR